MVKSSVGDSLFFLVKGDFFENFSGWLAIMSPPLNLPLSNDLIRYSWGAKGHCKFRVDPGQGLGGGSEGKAVQILHSIISERGPKTNPEAR